MWYPIAIFAEVNNKPEGLYILVCFTFAKLLKLAVRRPRAWRLGPTTRPGRDPKLSTLGKTSKLSFQGDPIVIFDKDGHAGQIVDGILECKYHD